MEIWRSGVLSFGLEARLRCNDLDTLRYGVLEARCQRVGVERRDTFSRYSVVAS